MFLLTLVLITLAYYKRMSLKFTIIFAPYL